MNKKITILGAGLSGLLTAYRLQNKGFDIEIIEARNRIGGRIHTIHSDTAQVEMGATWFNDIHINFRNILTELGIEYFEQFMQGTSYYESLSDTAAQEIQIPQNSPSYRVAGGTSLLIETLKNKLKAVPIHLNETVTSLNFENEKIQITTQNQSFVADYVISTLPQALFINDIIVSPTLPEKLTDIAQNTHTWMQDSIKVAFVYAAPFWRNKNYSGTLFSNVGPITEFYDQSNNVLDKFALCGFISAGMEMYSQTDRLEKLKTQLVKVFGQEALSYTSYHETIWAKEKQTKSTNQIGFMYPHQNNGHPLFRESYCDNRLFFAGTETANQYPGYMEGAVIAAENTVKAILKL
ncbi:NAD(P)/FAD-dependent oxidoreductase [Flavobacterium sp. K5-23]|uniref:flavin monoamine oxidase family protein n=1 Tax=Flavobacterium sp. K5-23 TaxID=2746225 RepID=UPI00200D3C3F|nr:NAD(P)/FAD-dependent oxidoreductase [Flavobacterium sp. K5-23]UQD55284.1 FAD-dependent oxidoreductase [Flavobacterium sp. K5-23]